MVAYSHHGKANARVHLIHLMNVAQMPTSCQLLDLARGIITIATN